MLEQIEYKNLEFIFYLIAITEIRVVNNLIPDTHELISRLYTSLQLFFTSRLVNRIYAESFSVGTQLRI